jgi:hypothetical protein
MDATKDIDNEYVFEDMLQHDSDKQKKGNSFFKKIK